MKKKRVLPIIMLMCIVLLCACNYNRKSMKNEYVEKDGEKEYAENTDREADTDRQIEKGYDLPIDARQKCILTWKNTGISIQNCQRVA